MRWLARFFQRAGLRSLRSHYLLVAVLLSLFVLGIVGLTHFYLSYTAKALVEHIEGRLQAMDHYRYIAKQTWLAEKALQEWILSLSANAQPILKILDRAQEYLPVMENQVLKHLDYYYKDREPLAKIQSDVALLQRNIKLMETLRHDEAAMYPIFQTHHKVLVPAEEAFHDGVGLAKGLIFEYNNNDIYQLFYYRLENLQDTWSRLILQFRDYLLYAEGITQERQGYFARSQASIIYSHAEITGGLDDLIAESRHHKLDRLTNSLTDLQQKAYSWWMGYQDINKQLKKDRTYRYDIVFARETLYPSFSQVARQLNGLLSTISNDVLQDIPVIQKVGTAILITLWVGAIVIIFLQVIGFLYLQHTILHPIAFVTKAIRAEGEGERSEFLLPATHTEETQTLINTFNEMRNQIHLRQVELEHQVTHDILTGLPNRQLIQDRLQQAILTARRNDISVAMLVMDLNRFKEINDTLGHDIGDCILLQVRARILEALRDSDSLARLGGDQFAILLPTAGEESARQVAERILNALARGFLLDEHNLFLSASIGITVYPAHGEDATTLIQRADVAMYQAKRLNIGYVLYDPLTDKHSLGRLALEGDLRLAIENSKLSVVYQPKLDLKTSTVIGVETLLRWNHPTRGPIRPDEIISVAEQTGLIKSLTLWVLDQAIKQAALWYQEGIRMHTVVNLSMWNLQDPDIGQEIKMRLDRWQLPPQMLGLEITESAMMSDLVQVERILDYFDGLGIRVAIDDYGTGFSSLAYLKKLPVDELKIDKSFVLHMTEDESDAVIVRSTIDLAHNLGLSVVAEGIENKDVWDLLVILGCDVGQGYYMSRPLPADELEKWLQKGDWKVNRQDPC